MRNKDTSLAIYLLVSIILSPSLIMCFATAFKQNVSWFLIALFSCVFTLLFTVTSTFIKSKKIYIPVIIGFNVLFLTFIYLNFETLVHQLNSTVNAVLKNYKISFDVPDSFSFMGLNINQEEIYDVTGLFTAILFIVCEILSISQVRWKNNAPIYIVSLILLVPCFIMVDTMPDIVPLFISIAIITAMYITGIARKHSVNFGNFIMPAVSILMIGVLVILSVIYPMDSYKRYKWQDNLLNYLGGKGSISGLNNGKTRIVTDITSFSNLEHLGDFNPDDKTLFKVKAEDDGTLYLKRETYSEFNDNIWSTITTGTSSVIYDDSFLEEFFSNSFNYDDESYKPFNPFKITQSKGDNYKKIHIFATDTNDYLLTANYMRKNSDITWYADSSLGYTDDYIYNLESLKEYDIEYYPENSSDLFKTNNFGLENYENELFYYCIDQASISSVSSKHSPLEVKEDSPIISEKTVKQILEDENEKGLKNALKGNDMDISKTAKLVEEYVKDIGTYSRHPDDYDPEMGTFPEWFIKNDGKGYCVHYATTAAAILRSMGIPARYVTGYCVEGKENKYVDVSGENAHAWVEYYDENIGWRTLDPTPTSETVSAANTTVPTTVNNQTKPTTNNAKNNNTNQNTDNSRLSPLVIIVPASIIVGIMAVLVFISLRAKRIRKKRKDSFLIGSNSKRIVNIFRYADLVNKINQNPLPERIYDLAVEAKYSNHNISDKSVKIMTEFAKEQQMKLYSNCGKLKRIYYLYFKVL